MAGCPHPPGWKLWHPSNGISFGALQSQKRRRALDQGPRGHRALHTGSYGAPPPWEAESAGSDLSASSAWADVRKSAPSLLESVAGAPSAPGGGSVEAQLAPEPAAVDGAENTNAAEDEEPPFTTLDYKFPVEAFRSARKAGSFWTYNFYRGQDDQKVTVHYCRSSEATERVCEYFLDEEVIGLDLEWAADASKWSGVRKNVSLIQMASPSRVALFHLALYPAKDDPAVASPNLKRIIEDPAITMCGVNIKGDCTRLRNYLGVNARGVFELSHLFKLVKYSKSGETHLVNKKLVSLADQTKAVLKLPLFKGQDVRASNWSKPLRMDQILYSASDAYAGLQIFNILDNERMSLDPTPPRPYHSELDLPIRLAEPNLESSSAEGTEITAEELTDEAVDLSVEVGIDDLDDMATLLQVAFEESQVVFEESQVVSEKPQTVFEQLPDRSEEPDQPPPELDMAVAGKPSKATPRKRATATPKQPKEERPLDDTPKQPKDERVLAAERWAEEYRISSQASASATAAEATADAAEATEVKKRATAAALRVYHIWHNNPDLELADIAAMVRDPPLQTSTVLSYILAAAKYDALPYDSLRMRSEIFGRMPHSLIAQRYSAVYNEVRMAAAVAAAAARGGPGAGDSSASASGQEMPR